MYKILALNKISKTGTVSLEGYQLSENEADPDAIILRSFNMHDTELPKSLLAVARAGAGTNNIPIDKCTEAGVVVFNTPGANANAVKEMVLAAMLLSNRDIIGGANWTQSLKGTENIEKQVEDGKKNYIGAEIMGKTLGVIGLGAIGVLVANAASALGMTVIGYDPYVSQAAKNNLKCTKLIEDINEIYTNADYISLHVPYNASTKGTINADALSKMKDGVHILNFARGEIVDNTALLAAIESGRVERYITDFPSEEILGVKNIIAIPHLAASTPEAEENCAVMASEQLKKYLETGNIKNSVNLPDCEMPFTGKPRVSIINKNIPNMIMQITAALADKKINISNMANSSKGEYAYTLIELDEVTPCVEDYLKEIDGIIRVRVI